MRDFLDKLEEGDGLEDLFRWDFLALHDFTQRSPATVTHRQPAQVLTHLARQGAGATGAMRVAAFLQPLDPGYFEATDRSDGAKLDSVGGRTIGWMKG